MRILLVQPEIVIDASNPKKYIFSPGNEIPLNVLYLSAFLEQNDFDHHVLDLRMHHRPWNVLDRMVRDYAPHLVCVTACSCEMVGAHLVAERVKRIDDTIATAVGGIHVSALPEQTLADYPAFDVVVAGEGEFTLLELATALKNGSDWHSVAGTTVQLNGSVRSNSRRPLVDDIDVFPFPNRKRINIRRYYPNPITYNHKRLPTTGIIASRGCPYFCYHCSKGVWGPGARYRSAENVLNEIQECVENFGVRDFRFYDDVFTMKEGPLEPLCQMIIDHGLDISFNCYSRIDHITPELLKLMKRAGCYHVKYGVESSSETAIAMSNRHTTEQMARDAIRRARDAGILAKATFMMGMPGETEADFPRTVALANRLEPDLVSFGLFTLFPGSVFHTRIQEGDRDLAESIPDPQSVLPYISRGYKGFYFRGKLVRQHLEYLRCNPDAVIYEIKRFGRGFLTLLWYVIRRLFRAA
ncbi:MAG TPA: radical SAM protein [bacterium]|nr:radical SAM protein [bacterium]